MCAIIIFWLYIISVTIESAVLDPALYLSPSPPFIGTSKELSPAELWSWPLNKRAERDAQTDLSVSSIRNEPTEEWKEESMKSSETFWPLFRNVDYSVRGIHIPLTFSVSGTYGKHYPDVGVISSNYETVTGVTKVFESSGKTALAGSRYGAYQFRYPGVRIYGRDNEPAWNGWGNGKWGHYGKG